MSVSLPQPNPDKLAIQNKTQISISVSPSDIQVALSGSNDELLAKVALTNSEQRMKLSTVLVENEDELPNDGLTGVYYTPMYTEQINYTEWLRRIDKTFNELEV